MSNRVIDKSVVTDSLGELLTARQVFAPARRDGLLSFELLSNGDEVFLGSRNTRQSPRGVFFPCSETLFTYKEDEIIPASLPEGRRVVWGLRPCDARSAVLLDKVFDAADFQDPYYVTRRQRTVLVGLACDRPASTCFCTAVGGGPFSVDGLDLLCTDLGDRYFVEAVTERGEALVVGSSHFRPATERDAKLKAEIAARAEETVSGPDVQGITEKLGGMYDDPLWNELHQKCLGCAACTYLCPTCHCFDIVDEGDREQGRRVRNWDTCQFALFTHHTSGHNPRPSGKERMRQRIMHKFNYFVKNFGQIACVGCGRCVRACPVNLDIRAVIEAVGQV